MDLFGLEYTENTILRTYVLTKAIGFKILL